MKQALRETRTLRAGCSKVRTPPARPPARPRAATNPQTGPIAIYCAAS